MIKNILITICLFILTDLTLLRNSLWNDEVKLWFDTLQKSPSKPRVLDSVGKSLANKGR